MIADNTLLVPRIENRIQVIRGLRVMLDVDLAALYGVQTKRLNEQVKRNRDRFPSDFLFQLTADEKTELVASCDQLQNLKFSKALPLRLLSTEPPKRPTGPARCPKDGRHRERPTNDIDTPASHANSNQHKSRGAACAAAYPVCRGAVRTITWDR
jgi:hypothetical protein